MSEFEEFARTQGFSGEFQRGCNGQYKSDLLHFMEKAFVHQQSEIDQLKAEKEKLEIKLSETEQVYRNVVDMELAKVEKLKAEKAGLEKTIQDALEVITSKISDCRISENNRNLSNWQQNTAFLIREGLQVLEGVLRGEHE